MFDNAKGKINSVSGFFPDNFVDLNSAFVNGKSSINSKINFVLPYKLSVDIGSRTLYLRTLDLRDVRPSGR